MISINCSAQWQINHNFKFTSTSFAGYNFIKFAGDQPFRWRLSTSPANAPAVVMRARPSEQQAYKGVLLPLKQAVTGGRAGVRTRLQWQSS
jgi:hypothetical protein